MEKMMLSKWVQLHHKLCPRGSGPKRIMFPGESIKKQLMCPKRSGMEQIMCPRELGTNHISCLGCLRQVFNCPRGCAIVQI